MTEHENRLRNHLTRAFISWMNGQYERQFALTTSEATAETVDAVDGEFGIEIRFATLFASEDDASLNRELTFMEERLTELAPGGYILWAPPGGKIPTEEPAASDFALRFESTAQSLGDGETGSLALPATVHLSKIRDDGAYVSVMGGLSPYWTNISEHVRGAFILDSTQLRRPSREEAWLEALYERLGRNAATLAVNEMVSIETEQAWTLQALPEASGTTIVAGPTNIDPTDGTYVRRTLRRRVVEANKAVASRGGMLQALLLAGAYDYMDKEPATAALRGFDPSTYSNLDLIALAADGEIKYVLPPRRLPWS